MEVFEKKKIAKGLYRIRVRLTNNKAIPSITYHTVKDKVYPMDVIKLSGKGVNVVSGGKITNLYFDKVSYKKYKPEVQFCQVPGFGKVEYQFLVSGKGELKISYESRKAGKLKKTIDL